MMRNPLRRPGFWVAVLLILVAVVGLAVLFAPRLVCWYVQRLSPLTTPDVVIRGARFGGPPPVTLVQVACPPGQFHALCAGAAERWVPRALFANGQHVWGTAARIPEITWRFDLDGSLAEPRIAGRVPAAYVERYLERQLAVEHAPVSQVHLALFSIQGEPTPDGVEHLRLRLSGSANYRLGDADMPLRIDELALTLALHRQSGTDGRMGFTGTAVVERLQGSAPVLGDLAGFKAVLEQQLNQRLGTELPKTLVHDWTPLASRWDLVIQAASGTMAEY